jgi:DNA-binding transcriptional MerR regulator
VNAGPAPARMTIGAVLARLKPDFPDVSISKIRFLEAEGLVTPSRTGSGYRTFSEQDVERLHYILSAQRDRFWPLKVIRDALDALDRGLQPTGPGDAASRPTVPAAVLDPGLPTPQDLTRPSSLRLTASELRQAAGLDEPTFAELTAFGLLRSDSTGHYGESALAVARAAGALSAYGIEPRHLRPFRTAADREIGLVQQVTSPMRGRGSAGRAPTGEDPTPEILALCIALHTSLVRAGLAAQ